jgi:citronellyl-CoA dehydrogenase
MQLTQEHEELRRTVERFVEQELNPYVDEWEEAGIFPAHEVFRKLGDLGLLGLTKPEAYGGAALDYSYSLVMAEALGNTRCGGVPMAIGVQTDMATPALARFGTDELRAEFLAPAISGEQVACIGVSEPSAGSDVAGIRTTARKDGGDYVINGGAWITTACSRLDVLPREHQRMQPAPQQVADHRADAEQGRQRRAQAAQDRHELLRHGTDLLRRRARPAAPSDRP